MGHKRGPRSIRSKLVVALLLAIVPSLLSQVYHQYQEWARLGSTGSGGIRQIQLMCIRSLLAALVGLVVVFVTGNRLGHILRRLTHAAAAIAVGDYRRRVNIRTGDELEMLGETFNVLGESLGDREQAIRKHADMLGGMAEAARVASSSLNLRMCARAIARVTCTHLGARDAAVFHRSRQEPVLKPLGYCGRRPRAIWRTVAARAMESGDYLIITDRSTSAARSGEHDDATLVGVPLISASGPIGAIIARFEGTVTRSDVSLGSPRADMLMTFGVHAAAAVANADAYTQTERYSETLENWIDELSVVMRVADAISPSLTLDETLAALARETAAALDMDLCTILLPNRSGALAVRGCSKPDAMPSGLTFGIKDTETGRAFLEKRTVACRDTSKSKFAATRQIMRQMGTRGLLTTPLVMEDKAIGVLAVQSTEPHSFTPRETRLLTAIGVHTAVLVRNASLYTRESSIAETLQSNLVSAAPEECRGLRFASRYLPAYDEARVGGDFFEVVPLPNGKVGVLIADVSGKGLSAAIHLAACKYMLMPLMFANPDDPATVLTELNSAMNYYFDMSFFVTVFYGVIDPEEGVVEYANAGHVPALLIAEGGKVHTTLPSTGIPAGSGYGCNYGSGRVRVSPTDTLLLYTDGVIDARTEQGMLGIEGLHKLVFEADASCASELIDRVCSRLNGSLQAAQTDDMALLAVSFPGVQAGRRSVVGGASGQQYRLPTEPS